MAFVFGEQTSRIETRTPRTEARNLKILDGEDVDVLQRPDQNLDAEVNWLNEAGSMSILFPIRNIIFFNRLSS